MLQSSVSTTQKSFGVFAGILLAILSLYPQGFLIYNRGENFNGAAFFYDYDEPAYSSYIQSLIDGKPRNNSVYSGQNSAQNEETIFSIQALPAYLVAIPGRILGFGSELSFLLISVIFAFFSAFILFWFISRVTNQYNYAFVSTLFVLICGPNAAGISVLKMALGLGPSAFYLTFLRRFVPAVAFPFALLLIASVWFGLASTNVKKKSKWGTIAGMCFATLIFCYFFFWTSLLVWLLLIFALSSFLVPERRKVNLKYFWLPCGIISATAFIGYLTLILNRHDLADSAQILEHTRSIVYMRPTLLLGILVLLLVGVFIKANYLKLTNQTTIFTISFLLLPVFVFNQQVVTGLSLQPLHYNMYILNYLVLVGMVFLGHSLFKDKRFTVPSWVWAIAGCGLLGWGVIEMHHTSIHRYEYNARRDEARPVNLRLKELSSLGESGNHKTTFGFDNIQINNQTTVAPQGVVWAEHMLFLSNMSVEEHQQRYYLYLYLQNRDSVGLRKMLKSCPNQECRALIGWKINPTLAIKPEKVEDEEIESLVLGYSRFMNKINIHIFEANEISYVIARKDVANDFSNIDLWYERLAPEVHDEFLLFPLSLKKDQN